MYSSLQTVSKATENGIEVGNHYDKYNSKNFIARYLTAGFEKALVKYVEQVHPRSIHEVGCGEGFWVLKWKEIYGNDFQSTRTDFSQKVIDIARSNAEKRLLPPEIFQTDSIYDLTNSPHADLLLCSEVLEHLETPAQALSQLAKKAEKYVIISVPNEPIWRVCNMLRFKYLKDFGNTPGHIQHWSRKQITNLVKDYFHILDVCSPFPWTILLCEKKAKGQES